MFPAAYRSSSGAPNCICSLWFIYPCGVVTGRCPGWVGNWSLMKFIKAEWEMAKTWFNKTCRVKELTSKYIRINTLRTVRVI